MTKIKGLKKMILFSILMLTIQYGYCQNSILTLTFLGKDLSGFVLLDSIYIQNKTTGSDTILKGNNPTLIVNPSLGIKEHHVASNFFVDSSFPNPFDISSTIPVIVKHPCSLSLTLSDMNGKMIFREEFSVGKGVHKFNLQSTIRGTLLCTITDGNTSKTLKLISQTSSPKPNEIKYEGMIPEYNNFKAYASFGFSYHFGEQLLFTAYKNSYYNSTLLDSPNHDTIYTFNMVSFELPTVTTDSVTEITNNSAKSGGIVISDGGSTVVERGVCWSKNPNPTISNSHTTDGDSIGQFVSNITGLSGSTFYYVRSYATNSIGTSYGNEFSFTTLPNPFQCGQNVIYEEISYPTVKIGTRCWFKKNLNVGIMGIQGNDSVIQKDCMSGDLANCDEYGGLYTWDEMMKYTTSNGGQGICPNGWHIPTLNEWNTMINFVGEGLGNFGGYRLKEAGYIHWLPPNTYADNSSGFTALGAGAFFPPSSQWPGYQHLKMRTYFWTSTLFDTNRAYYYYLSYDEEVIRETHEYDKYYKYSVRCIKNFP